MWIEFMIWTAKLVSYHAAGNVPEIYRRCFINSENKAEVEQTKNKLVI